MHRLTFVSLTGAAPRRGTTLDVPAMSRESGRYHRLTSIQSVDRTDGRTDGPTKTRRRPSSGGRPAAASSGTEFVPRARSGRTSFSWPALTSRACTTAILQLLKYSAQSGDHQTTTTTRVNGNEVGIRDRRASNQLLPPRRADQERRRHEVDDVDHGGIRRCWTSSQAAVDDNRGRFVSPGTSRWNGFHRPEVGQVPVNAGRSRQR